MYVFMYFFYASQNLIWDDVWFFWDLFHLLNFLRPWSVECGDPNQYDVLWGICILNVKCEPESRNYRGDSFCGRNPFVCCTVMRTDTEWDHTANLEDISFWDSGLTTDSQEKRDRALKKNQIKYYWKINTDSKYIHLKRKRVKGIKKYLKSQRSCIHYWAKCLKIMTDRE